MDLTPEQKMLTNRLAEIVELAGAVRTLARAVRHLADIQESGEPTYQPGEPEWLPGDTARSVEQTVDAMFRRWSTP